MYLRAKYGPLYLCTCCIMFQFHLFFDMADPFSDPSYSKMGAGTYRQVHDGDSIYKGEGFWPSGASWACQIKLMLDEEGSSEA